MRPIDEILLQKVAIGAEKSLRKRKNFNFHKYKDKVQRIINVLEPDTYIRPHKHENPDKVEVFLALKGKGLVVTFTNKGQIKNHHIISGGGPVWGVEIPPRTWHCLISLSKNATFFEVIEGPFNRRNHKKFAPWAPIGNLEGRKYNKAIRRKLKA